MNMKKIEIDFERAAEILKCIAHPVRLQLLNALSDKKTLNVSELQIILNCECEQSMLSHHLTKMKDKGILTSEKEGKFIYYTLVDSKIQNLLGCLSNSTII